VDLRLGARVGMASGAALRPAGSGCFHLGLAGRCARQRHCAVVAQRLDQVAGPISFCFAHLAEVEISTGSLSSEVRVVGKTAGQIRPAPACLVSRSTTESTGSCAL
jgi:hypothetical protein